VTQFEVVVRNGRIVESDRLVDAALCIERGKVAALDHSGTARGRVEIDATGCILLPGGVDPHVHVAWPYQDYVSSDDFASASVAALFGGTTTIIDFAYPRTGMSAREYVEARRQQAEGIALVDFGFHTILVDVGDSLSSAEELVGVGSPSWKLYMT
jgi:dihydropyrimidinase